MRQTRSTKITKATTSETLATSADEVPRVHIPGDPELEALANESNEVVSEMLRDTPPVEAKRRGRPPKEKPKMTIDEVEEVQALADPDFTDFPEEFSEDDLKIKPAETLVEFSNAIALAKAQRTPSIKASKKVIFHWNKPHYPKNFFFYFEGIRVDEIGKEKEIEAYLTSIAGENGFGR